MWLDLTPDMVSEERRYCMRTDAQTQERLKVYSGIWHGFTRQNSRFHDGVMCNLVSYWRQASSRKNTGTVRSAKFIVIAIYSLYKQLRNTFCFIYKYKKECTITITICVARNTIGIYSPSGKTSYRQISCSLKAARLDVIMIVSLLNFTGACQISEQLEESKSESRGFETSRDLAVRRLTTANKFMFSPSFAETKIFQANHFNHVADDVINNNGINLAGLIRAWSWATSQYKDRLSMYRDSHIKDKTVSQPSYL